MSDNEEQIKVGLSVTWRSLGEEPQETVSVELGGPEQVVLTRVIWGEGDNECMIHIDATGFPDSESFIGILRGVADHMETRAAVMIDGNGVTEIPPLKGDGQ